jgi:hypothetical protein
LEWFFFSTEKPEGPDKVSSLSRDRANQRFRAAAWLILCVALSKGRATAQDMEPRSYSNTPVGMNFLVASYGRSAGDVVVSTSLPLRDVKATIYNSVLAFAHSDRFFGQSAKVLIAVPYAWGKASAESPKGIISGSRSGLADPVFKFSVNFFGAPALSPAEYVNYRQKTIVGASIQVTAPLSQYDANQRVNLGTNRWSLKPEIGVSRAVNRWTLEAYANISFFTTNSQYLGDSVLKQDPLTVLQGHVAYTFRPRLWAAVDFGFSSGGGATVNGITTANTQRNIRSGGTLSLPLTTGHSLKLFVSTGVRTTARTNFTIVGAAYQFSWIRWPLVSRNHRPN